jgi:hypothetical protein
VDARIKEETRRKIISAFWLLLCASKSNARPARANKKDKVADLMSATLLLVCVGIEA